MPFRALCIEPSASLRDVLAKVLRDAGWEADLCADLADMTLVRHRHMFNLVITAAQLPSGTYAEVLERFRDGAISGAFPVILLTSDIDAKTVSTALIKGVTEVFAKSDLPALRAYLDTLGASATGQFNGLRALVLEDDVSMGLYLGQVLGGLGMNVERHTRLESALAAVANAPYDLVITDIVLGGGASGNHFVRLLRNSGNAGRNVPVIAVSGFGDPVRRLDALRAGANIYLSKPFDEEELVLVILRLLGEDVLADGSSVEEEGRRYELSKRELAICKLVASGLSDKRIAEQLGISYWTVRTHMASMFRKCGVMNRIELANLFRRGEEREPVVRTEGASLAQCIVGHFADAVLVTDRKRRIVYINQAFSRITGYDEDEVLGRSPRILSSVRHSPRFVLDMLRQVGENGAWSGELWNRKKNGALFLAWLDIRELPPGSPMGAGYVAVISDVSERHAEYQRTRHYVLHDVLTGAGNRTMLEHQWGREVARVKRNGHKLGVLFVDLDRFRLLNDTLGNEAGDQLLVAVAARMRECMRDQDTLIRYGPDEFVVLLPDLADRSRVLGLAEKLRETLYAPIDVAGVICRLTVSIGISVYPDDGRELGLVVEQAGQAKRRAQEAGGNTIRSFGGNEAQAGRSSSYSEPRLELPDIDLRFHPRVELASGRIMGAEACLHWHDPERQRRQGGQGFDPAVHYEHSPEVFEWLLNGTCVSLRRLQAQHPERFGMTLKVPAMQLARRDFAVDVAAALARNGVPAERLQLSVAETTWLREPQRVREVLAQLRGMRVSVALDGFGSGGSCLGAFRELPCDTIQLDRSLVTTLDADRFSRVIGEGVIRMAQDFGLNVTADGVESAAHVDVLLEIGCQLTQGPLFGEPLSETELLSRLALV